MDQRDEIAVAIPGAIRDLSADLRQRSTLPSHRLRREMPLRMAGDVACIEIAGVVTGFARHPGRAMSIGAADNKRPVRAHPIGLSRALGRRMAVHAAWMLQHFAGFHEQRHRAFAAIRDLVEAGDWPQFLRKGLTCVSLRGGLAARPRQGGRDKRDHANSKGAAFRPHHPVRRTIGSRRGRSIPSRAIALATAGPIGGTPGSPTPVGFSADGRIVTSTSGIWLMRSER